MLRVKYDSHFISFGNPKDSIRYMYLCWHPHTPGWSFGGGINFLWGYDVIDITVSIFGITISLCFFTFMYSDDHVATMLWKYIMNKPIRWLTEHKPLSWFKPIRRWYCNQYGHKYTGHIFKGHGGKKICTWCGEEIIS